jgi:fibronectin-binding autotransporter adhesin
MLASCDHGDLGTFLNDDHCGARTPSSTAIYVEVAGDNARNAMSGVIGGNEGNTAFDPTARTLHNATGSVTLDAINLELEGGAWNVTAGDFTLDTGDLILTLGDIDLDAGSIVVDVGDITITAGDLNVTAGNLVVTAGVLQIAGLQVVTSQQSAIADASAVSGTATTGGDGFVDATEFNNFISGVNAIKDQLNLVISALEAHGLIATV